MGQIEKLIVKSDTEAKLVSEQAKGNLKQITDEESKNKEQFAIL